MKKVRETFDSYTSDEFEGRLEDVIADLQKIKDEFDEFVILNSASPTGRTGIENLQLQMVTDEDEDRPYVTTTFMFVFDRDELPEEKKLREELEEIQKKRNEEFERQEFERLTKKFTSQV